MVLCCKRKKKQAELDELKKEVDIDDHRIPLEELLARLTTNVDKGLSSQEAADRLRKNGKNALTPPDQQSVLMELLEHLFGGFNFLLWGAGFFSLLGYILEYTNNEEAAPDNLYMAIILVTVVVVTGFFSFYQNRTSANIMKSFANMIPPIAHVMRDGNLTDIKVEEIVVGDLVVFSLGDKVPADCRVIQARGLKVDNSSLTGESEPQSRTPECTHNNPLETKNLVMFSTNVLEGTGKGIVIKTGDNTVMGRIAAITSQVSSGPTPIAKEIRHFIRVIGTVAFIVASACFIVSVINGAQILDAIVFMMGIFVANVPEAITATVTASLTLTAKKMRKKFCLVKKLEAVETLGSTSTICSDKTGTLTQNRMTAAHVWVDDSTFETIQCGENGKPTGESLAMHGSYAHLMRCATLCSRSDFKNDDVDVPVQKRETVGDASEAAILKYCELAHGQGDIPNAVREYRQAFPKVCEIPFNSNNKYQVSIHSCEQGGHILVMKGAPERLVALCSSISTGGRTVKMTDDLQKGVIKACENLGSMGERVLGFCDLDLRASDYPIGYPFDAENVNFPLKDMRFLGLISMIDPPRPGVPMAVRLCQSAGIKVVMVTGDHPVTAHAIAKQVHIIEDKVSVTMLIEGDGVQKDEVYGHGALAKTTAAVVHGEQLKRMGEATIDSIVANYQQVVFARTSPTQKLQIVEAYQRAGQIVAVTGDGVNDAPALRKADIGIAMGIAGTDVSKQAADMILLNDNFASIVTGVEEGRIIFDNLKKSIAYVLTSNIGEVTPFISYVILGFPLPMSLISILLIDMGTDLWPAISLAYELPESDIMQRPPRNAKHDNLVNARLILFSYLHIGVMQATAGFCTYFVIMMRHGWLPSDLLNLRYEWDNDHLNSLEDSFGQQWSYVARKELEHTCHSGFFFTMVMVQWADLFIAKTRKNSIVVQGLENFVLNFGMLSTTILVFIFLYIPGLNTVLAQVGLRMSWTMVALPFAIFIFMYDEIRKYVIRRYPGGIIYRLTNY